MNLFADAKWVDLLSGVTVNPEDEELELVPYQTVWISNEELTLYRAGIIRTHYQAAPPRRSVSENRARRH